jgi:hypothetical protein
LRITIAAGILFVDRLPFIALHDSEMMKFLNSGSVLPVDSLQIRCCRSLSQNKMSAPVISLRYLRLGKRAYHNKIHNNLMVAPLFWGSTNVSTSLTSGPHASYRRTFATQDDASQVILKPLTSKEAQLLMEASVEARRISALALNSPQTDSSSVIDRTQILKCFNASSTLLSLTEPQKTFADVILRQNSGTKEHVCSLHWAFLSVISWCISLAPHDNALVHRALNLAFRADELGLPLHLPLYQDLMRAIAEHTDKGIIYNIFKISRMITPALGVPIEGDHFSAAAVALVRRRKIFEAVDLLLRMNDKHDVSFIGYEGTQEIFVFLLTQFGDPVDDNDKEGVNKLIAKLHNEAKDHACSNGKPFLHKYARNIIGLLLVAQPGILTKDFAQTFFGGSKENDSYMDIFHDMDLVNSDQNESDDDDDDSVPMERSRLEPLPRLSEDVKSSDPNGMDILQEVLLSVDGLLRGINQNEADNDYSDDEDHDGEEDEEKGNQDAMDDLSDLEFVKMVWSASNDDNASFEIGDDIARRSLYSRALLIPDILDQLGDWGVNARFTSQFEDLLIERKRDFDDEEYEDLDDDDYNDEEDGFGDDDNDNHDD